LNYSSRFFVEFIKLAGPFWHSENKATIHKLTLGLIIFTIMQIAIAVLLTEWSANLFNTLDQRSMSGLTKQIVIIALILIANVIVTSNHLKMKRQLQIDWRSWLTHRLIGEWMNNGRHYQIKHMEGRHDNPDGRIAEDIRIATEYAIDLIHSLFYCLLLIVSFTQILWTLSGQITLKIGGLEFPVYGHLVWLAIIYAAFASTLGWIIGRPLTQATDARQTEEADFRFGLVTARENSIAIALVRGESTERNRFLHLFNDIYRAWQRQTRVWSNLLMFTSGYSVFSMAFPILISAPRYIAGFISLGGLVQSAQAFQQMAGALSWPVDNMAKVAEWRASVERVLGLVNALDDLEKKNKDETQQRIRLVKSEESVLGFNQVCIAKLNGEMIIACIEDQVKQGEHVLISGNGATAAKLFKAIAGLWPWGKGTIYLPDDEPMYFMPPRPYLPRGTLRSAICYPYPVSAFNQADLEQAFDAAGLNDLLEQLDHVDQWEKTLSREQMQRLGLVRLLLVKPKWILVQEAFDSLDPEGEADMLRLITERLPDASLLTIMNQPTADAFHERRLTL